VKSPGAPPKKEDEEGKKDACRRFPGEGKTKPLMFCGNTNKRRRARVSGTRRVIFLAAGGRPCKPGRLRLLLPSKYAAAIVVAVSLLLRGWRLQFYSDEGEVQSCDATACRSVFGEHARRNWAPALSAVGTYGPPNTVNGPPGT